MKLAAFLKKERKSLTSFSEESEVSIAMLSRIISGKRIPSPATAERIEKATNGKVKRLELLYP